MDHQVEQHVVMHVLLKINIKDDKNSSNKINMCWKQNRPL
jgi:hypothetical protein